MTFINKVMYKKSVQQLLQPDAFFVTICAHSLCSFTAQIAPSPTGTKLQVKQMLCGLPNRQQKRIKTVFSIPYLLLYK